MGDTAISSSGGVDLFVFTALFHFPSPGVSFVQLSTSNSDHISLHSHGTPQGPKGSPVQCQPPGSFQQENTGSVMRGECTGLSQASPEPRQNRIISGGGGSPQLGDGHQGSQGPSEGSLPCHCRHPTAHFTCVSHTATSVLTGVKSSNCG